MRLPTLRRALGRRLHPTHQGRGRAVSPQLWGVKGSRDPSAPSADFANEKTEACSGKVICPGPLHQQSESAGAVQ